MFFSRPVHDGSAAHRRILKGLVAPNVSINRRMISVHAQLAFARGRGFPSRLDGSQTHRGLTVRATEREPTGVPISQQSAW